MTTPTTDEPGLRYYDGPDDLIRSVRDALMAAGRDPDRPALDDLALLDEFHALGRAATIALAELAAVQPGARVLDVGAGIGGPARVLADRYGACVTALDATPRFCRASEWLCAATGLADRVTVVCADALELPFADGEFDVVWTQALSQNVADKARMYAEMHRVLTPGGHLALFDVVAGPAGPPHFPVPWADRPEQSFLVEPAELRRLVTTAGLRIVTWNENEDAQPGIQRAGAGLAASPPGVDLSVLLPDFDDRMAGLARNVSEQRIGLVQAVLTRP